MSAPKNGPAFPGMELPAGGYAGMSLRDYFAAAALTGIIAAYSGPDCSIPENQLAATTAYEYADAMLLARDARDVRK